MISMIAEVQVPAEVRVLAMIAEVLVISVIGEVLVLVLFPVVSQSGGRGTAGEAAAFTGEAALSHHDPLPTFVIILVFLSLGKPFSRTPLLNFLLGAGALQGRVNGAWSRAVA